MKAGIIGTVVGLPYSMTFDAENADGKRFTAEVESQILPALAEAASACEAGGAGYGCGHTISTSQFRFGRSWFQHCAHVLSATPLCVGLVLITTDWRYAYPLRRYGKRHCLQLLRLTSLISSAVAASSFRCRRILLCQLAQLAHRQIDLPHAGGLFVRGGGDLPRSEVLLIAGTISDSKSLARSARSMLLPLHRRSRCNLARSASFRYFGSHHQKPLSVLAGTSGPDSGVQCQQIIHMISLMMLDPIEDLAHLPDLSSPFIALSSSVSGIDNIESSNPRLSRFIDRCRFISTDRIRFPSLRPVRFDRLRRLRSQAICLR